MQIALLIGGTLAIFFYALSRSSADNADTESADTAGDFSGSQDLIMGSPDRQALLKAFAIGIANGEGYFRTGTKPNRLNNPGDLKIGGQIANFLPDTYDEPLPGGGWAAIYHQLNITLNGSSNHYDLGMTLRDFSRTWTADQDPSAELDSHVAAVVAGLNQGGFPATENTTLGALARGDFSA